MQDTITEVLLKMQKARAALFTAVNAMREEVPEQSHAAELLDVAELAADAFFDAEQELRALEATL